MDVLSRDQCEKYFESNRILLGAQTDNTRKCSSSNPVYGIKIEIFYVLAVLQLLKIMIQIRLKPFLWGCLCPNLH